MKTIFTIFFLLLASSAFAQATQTANFSVSWTWGAINSDGSNTPTGAKVERSSNGTAGPFSQIALVPYPNSSMNDSITGDLGGKIYCYRVRATNNTGDSGYSGIACATSPVIAPVSLNAPTKVNAAPLPAATSPKQ